MSARLALTTLRSSLKDEPVVVIESEMIVKHIAKKFSAEVLNNFLKIINSINIKMQKIYREDFLLAY